LRNHIDAPAHLFVRRGLVVVTILGLSNFIVGVAGADEEEESEEEASDEDEEGEEGEEGSEGEGFEKIRTKMEKKKDKLLSMDPKEITYEMVTKKVQEINLARGKKGVDRQEQAGAPERVLRACLNSTCGRGGPGAGTAAADDTADGGRGCVSRRFGCCGRVG
jgi:Eukaryotic translation initiation factor 3 subunit 8 N-terminus